MNPAKTIQLGLLCPLLSLLLSAAVWANPGDSWEAVDDATLAILTLDSDGDTLFDLDEQAIGSNPYKVDSDGDGYADAFENDRWDFGFDPRRFDKDSDRDGLSDHYEAAIGTNAKKVDSDGDRFSDFDEVLGAPFGFHPFLPSFDEDFDGLEDRYEQELGLSSTSPDTDRDGYGDFEEIFSGLDPRKPDPQDLPGDMVGLALSQRMADTLKHMRQGGEFPLELAGELPYPQTNEALLHQNFHLVPSAALMQLAVANPVGDAAGVEPDPSQIEKASTKGPGTNLYPSYNSVVSTLQAAASGSNVARLFVWSRRTIEEGGAGRRIYALKISDNVTANEDETEVLFMGVHHARELLTITILLESIQRLTAGYPGDPLIKKKVDENEFWFIPLVNPDGYHRARTTHLMWRKNARRWPNVAGQAVQGPGTWGVDLNRNYSWEHIRQLQPAERAGLSPRAKGSNGLLNDAVGTYDPPSSTFAGTEFSEVETQAVRGLVNNRFRTGAEVGGIKCSISWHTQGGCALHPLSHTPVPSLGNPPLSAEERRQLGALTAIFAKITNYANVRDQFPVTNYPVYGDSEDWLFREKDILALTIEAYSRQEHHIGSPGFYPSQAAVRDQVSGRNVDAGLAVACACLPDWGDADDPFKGPGKYPSLKANNGANHLDYSKEWLGAKVDGEDDAQVPDQDEFDDGVSITGPLVAGQPVDIEVTVSVLDRNLQESGAFRYDSSDPKKKLYLNAWADWNGDGVWAASEKIIGSGAGNFAVNPRTDAEFAGGNQGTYTFTITPPAGGTSERFYMRFRLDYGEDVGEVCVFLNQLVPALSEEKGTAHYGEVEDYPATMEVDHFPTTYAELSFTYLGKADAGETVELRGPTTIHVGLQAIGDADGDGLEEVPAVMTQMELTGTHSELGAMVVRLRSPSEHPFLESVGQIEETVNLNPGKLDIPPCVNVTGLTAQSNLFPVVEVELSDLGMTLHTHSPKDMDSQIKHKPPKDPDEMYWSFDHIYVYNELEEIVGKIEESHHEPAYSTGVTTSVTFTGEVDHAGPVIFTVEDDFDFEIEGCLTFTAAQIASEMATAINASEGLALHGVSATAKGDSLEVNGAISNLSIEAGGVEAKTFATTPAAVTAPVKMAPHPTRLLGRDIGPDGEAFVPVSDGKN